MKIQVAAVFVALLAYAAAADESLRRKEQSPKPLGPYDPVLYPLDACENIDQDTVWDYVIVGAGPSGGTLGRRLAENKKTKVLILEAGGDPVASTDIPANFFYEEPYVWNMTAMPQNNSCLGRANGKCGYNYGKFLGGSSVINQMMYVRGNKKEYNEWEAADCPGWGWKDFFPYFLKLENFQDPRHEYKPDWQYHNVGGPFTTSPSQKDPQSEPMRMAMERSMKKHKVPYTNDHNGKKQTGWGDLTLSFTTVGYRNNAAKAYLTNIPDNLKVCKYAVVQRVAIDGDKSVTGVEYLYKDEQNIRVAKAKEYILAAGPSNTPQILERSGIGQKDILEKAGVEQVHELKGVGEGVREHVGNMACAFSYNPQTQVARNPLSLSFTSFSMFLNMTDYNDPVPDLQFIFTPGTDALLKIYVGSISDQYKKLLDKGQIMISAPVVMIQPNPGYIHITQTNPLMSPDLFLNIFSSDYEKEMHGKGCRLMREIMADDLLKPFKPEPVQFEECKKYEYNSDDEIMCHAGLTTFQYYHISGTTKMGPEKDEMAVVGTDLRVHGIKKLRVVDLGLIPGAGNIRGNTEIPSIALGEKAADMIKKADRRPYG